LFSISAKLAAGCLEEFAGKLKLALLVVCVVGNALTAPSRSRFGAIPLNHDREGVANICAALH
jgi:hypothetical protein